MAASLFSSSRQDWKIREAEMAFSSLSVIMNSALLKRAKLAQGAA